MAELAKGIIYGIEDKPPIGKRAVLALQHVLTMFGSTVSVPLLLGPAMNMTPSEIVILGSLFQFSRAVFRDNSVR